MTSKGTQQMAQKIVIKKPWGVEVKDYKAGDPIPAGAKFKIFDAKDVEKIDSYADSLDESATYQKKRFKEPYYMYNESAKTLIESFIIQDSDSNNKPVYFHYGKYTGYDWGFDKKMATKFSTKEAAERMIEKMRQEGMLINSMKVVSEGRIAKGYENLDAEEKARHLLSHPSSKYMNDLKSENITERAIRKAVKEMLGKPDKRDPQFITDVNEEGEAPAIANTTAEVSNPDLPLKLKESFDVKDGGNGKVYHTAETQSDAEAWAKDNVNKLHRPLKVISGYKMYKSFEPRTIVKEDCVKFD